VAKHSSPPGSTTTKSNKKMLVRLVGLNRKQKEMARKKLGL
jgi:hypothetical protein